jgi:hypothetical protein
MTDKTKLKQQIEEMEEKLEEMRSELDKVEKWEPEGGKYFILGDGGITETATIFEYRVFGTERKTREAAEKARNEMRVFNRLLAYRDEFAPGYEPDMYDFNHHTWFVYYNKHEMEFRAYNNYTNIDVGKVYMPEAVAKELVRKLNSGEVVL